MSKKVQLNDKVSVTHHGGKSTVTGSCHELKIGNDALLVDCGLFQGEDAPSETLSALNIAFPIQHIAALVLTHSHIDHIGRLPWLLAAGFAGPIYCTKATAELVPLMLEDGLKLQLGFNRGQQLRIIELVRKRIRAIDYGCWFPIKSKVSGYLTYGRFSHAGHILGSAYVEFKLPNQEIVVFSGDLGPNDTPLLPDPVAPERADYLFIESTYGDSQHQDIASRSERLHSIIKRSLEDGGAIIIPAFSVGRTQELLFDIEQLIAKHQLDKRLPIILDSPLALRVTKSYRRFKKLWGSEARKRIDAQRHPLNFSQCVTVASYSQHRNIVNRLKASAEPAIIIAASGMCQGGRVMEYLKALLPDARTDVIFAGFQAKGTLGSEIQSGAKTVWIDEEPVNVNAQVHSLSGYSAHAGQDDLLRFIETIDAPIKQLHLIHGESDTKLALKEALERRGYRGMIVD
ncbi:MBL fold metallo-hydrolase RNA specificity domain-containing protein [Vibrio mediterranei]|uniref:MBL fold metallo-hydrolase RNA specificity domain-containing protein n=1 Tax=Vibrio mediterranei TaxID=689 RepID=UPI00406844EB